MVEEVPHAELLKRALHAPIIVRVPDLDSYRIVTITGCDLIPRSGTRVNDTSDIRHLSVVRVEEFNGSFRLVYDVTQSGFTFI